MSRLSEPLKVGNCNLQHRIVMAPMTRLRADNEQVPQQMMADYYAQRGAVRGTLIITEANFISAKARGRAENAPGMFTKSQIEEWARVCDAVHENGSFIFAQLWHVGRAAQQSVLEKQGIEMVSSSAVPISDQYLTPRPMTEEDIWESIEEFAQAARNAIAAGFDGVEIHGANGYLIDQFTQDTCNRRSDGWGGSIPNRSRFCIEVVKAVCSAIGPERTSLRLSPFSDFQAMRMKDPVPQFTYLITQLRSLGLAYLHLIEPRVSGNVDREKSQSESLDFALQAWNKVGPVVLAGGYTPDSAIKRLENDYPEDDIAIAFGRHFTANPDLPFRLMKRIPFTPYSRDGFYTIMSADGYTTFEYSEAWKTHHKELI